MYFQVCIIFNCNKKGNLHYRGMYALMQGGNSFMQFFLVKHNFVASLDTTVNVVTVCW